MKYGDQQSAIVLVFAAIMIFFIFYGALKRWSSEKYKRVVSIVSTVCIIIFTPIVFYDLPLALSLPLSLVFILLYVGFFNLEVYGLYELILLIQEFLSNRPRDKVREKDS